MYQVEPPRTGWEQKQADKNKDTHRTILCVQYHQPTEYNFTNIYCHKQLYLRHTFSAAKKNDSSTGQHEQKNKKNTHQIKFSVVKIKQQIKLVLQHSLCKKC